MADLNNYVDQVMQESEDWGFNVEPTRQALLLEAVCLAGEVGELCNNIKKLQRPPQLLNAASYDALVAASHEELVDVLIYWCKLASFLGMDIDAAWDKKHEALHKRWDGKLNANKNVYAVSPD